MLVLYQLLKMMEASQNHSLKKSAGYRFHVAGHGITQGFSGAETISAATGSAPGSCGIFVRADVEESESIRRRWGAGPRQSNQVALASWRKHAHGVTDLSSRPAAGVL
ncbi:hypothetical protein PVAP13_5NG419200 [Panicum virgatum]|uniref:Uncharacterized protein n=1 Tax=Panicum virgatum TaxID=38727 RepID=A0A8T0S1C2_PANVG|nr:hypothetical protein PVAP13_5NG419200 [Panicum virgatum]KAG2590613.1 hypothetical protein PVAP13_5NG419200 [Panicum virgatum]